METYETRGYLMDAILALNIALNGGGGYRHHMAILMERTEEGCPHMPAI